MSSKHWNAIALIALVSFAAYGADPAPTTTETKTSTTAAQSYGTWGFDLNGMDRNIKPGDDFFNYVNGKWAATTQIPPDQTRTGAFILLRDLSEARVRAILDRWAADKNLKSGSDEAKVAAMYRSYLDEAAAEKLDAKPLQPKLDAVRKAETREDLVKLMAHSFGTAGSTIVGAFVGDDAKNPEKYALYLSQAGLGLPDREFYLQDKFKAQKERYQKYVGDLLALAGWEEPEKNAAEVVAFETKLAQAFWTRAESRDRDKTYNPMTVADLEKNAPGFPWALFFKEAGIDKADRAIVRQNTVLPKVATIFSETPLPTLKAWEAFHTADDAAPLLSKRFVDANWEFREKFLNGALEQRPRWKRAVEASEGAMGEAIGRTYVAEYFPPESKAKMEKLVADLRASMKGRIEKLSWMSDPTKKSALEKLTKFGVKIGYPTKWRDYSKLEVKEGDLTGNVERAGKFQWAFQVNRIGKPVDEAEWGMTPQTVNAYYNPPKNEIVFPAAILQPPFFDPKADPAVNYGAIGGVIGHEISHGFDDQGRKSDGDGVLRDWWAKEDAQKFEVQAAKLGAQYEAVEFPQLPNIHIIGKQTMGENIGDLGGILMALDAYHLSLKGQPAPVIDGFTGDQRVFLGWGQVWRTLMRDDRLRQLIMTDSHSPGQVRAVNPLRNVDAWYEAFGIKEGDKQYVKPEERVRIW
ncbi:MAG TPA: M13-type metalloendopeptidase [Thermoanaerobaculia bacterium]|nr:M13-type metalloendopeptidase [Thermoanaerobaculia bacterium]